MMRMRTALAAAVLVCAAAAAPAQDADAETRFHRAYEREVVDGKVADAAREYLAMMEDAKVPERLRQEAKFRFAVTTMLLGRADEARVHFGALAADATAPETLRARAGEYLDAAKGVGVGNEIDKKLQSLVFDLAKDKEPTPAAYRDFEVIGKRAVPFLRQLLQHEDAGVRTHAFRILCGVREPGMAELWTPARTANAYAAISFNGYVTDLAAERAVFERRLLALDDEALGPVIGLQSYLRPPYSAETLRALAARKFPARVLIACFPTAWTAETDRVRGEWIQSDDADLSAEATLSYLAFVKFLPEGNIALRTDLFPAIVARLETTPLASMPPYGTSKTGQKVQTKQLAVDGLSRLTASMPPEAILDALAKEVERGAAAPPGDANPLRSGLVHALATAIDRRQPNAELPARYGEILKTWGMEASKQGYVPMPDFEQHVAMAVHWMPVEAATSLSVWAVTTPLTGVKPTDLAAAVPTTRPQDIPVAIAALRAADREVRASLIGQLGPGNAAMTPEYAREYLRILPELVRFWIAAGQSQSWPPVGDFVVCARSLPAEEARDRFVEMAEAVAEVPDPNKRQQSLTHYLLGVPAPNQEDRSAYWAEVALPALDRVWPKLADVDRGLLMGTILSLLDKGPRDAALRKEIAKFTAARYGDVPGHAAQYLAASPDLFPLAEWVPKVSPNSGVGDNTARIPSERADPAARELTADPAAVNMAVLKFVDMSASPEVRTEVMDRLLRTCAMEQMLMVSFFLGRASPDALEDALRRVLAEKAPDLTVVSRLLGRLQAVHPSEAMLPGVRLLLASGKPEHVATGVNMSKALGREDLLPDLAGLLDSMDPNVRNSAKEAIDAIVALRNLKDEARRGAGGK
jgi:hypothetical protein